MFKYLNSVQKKRKYWLSWIKIYFIFSGTTLFTFFSFFQFFFFFCKHHEAIQREEIKAVAVFQRVQYLEHLQIVHLWKSHMIHHCYLTFDSRHDNTKTEKPLFPLWSALYNKKKSSIWVPESRNRDCCYYILRRYFWDNKFWYRNDAVKKQWNRHTYFSVLELKGVSKRWKSR